MFEWDDDNVEHLARHAVAPEGAEEAVSDPDRTPAVAYRVPGERRRAIIGVTQNGRSLYVVYTVRRRVVRVVSARDATERNRQHHRRAQR